MGADCLQAIQTSLSSSNGDASTLQRFAGTLTSCQIAVEGLDPAAAPPGPASPPAPPAPTINDTCLSGFSAALTSCGGSGTACCEGVRELGDACLQELAVKSSLFASVIFGQIAQTCGLNSIATDRDEELPPGVIAISWAALGRDGVACPAWSGTRFDVGTNPEWNATGTDMPTDPEINAVAERWCSNRDSAVPEMFQALDAGGRTAQIAVAAFWLRTCPTDNQNLWMIMDLLASEQLKDIRTTVPYIKAMVDAADASGINFCASVAVVSNVTGRTLYSSNFHTGPQADEPDGCLPNFEQAQVICSNATAPPAQPCCDAVGALGATCRASVAASTDSLISSAYSSIASSCGPFSDTPDTGDGLPNAKMSYLWRSGPTAQCYSWDVAAQGFTPDDNSTWAYSANDAVYATDVEEFASQVCPLAENAGQFLVQAFATGGDQAKVAAYVLTRASVCGNQTASDAALNAFMAACVTTERQRALQLIKSLVDAADQVGAGFCVTIAITDRQSGTLLDEWQIHTSVAASAPSVPPAVSRRRRLRGLLDNDVLSTLRSSARSRAARP